jgi:HEAT repeat protein
VIRAQAAKSLGALGADDGRRALEAALADQAWWVRANAATSLRQLGDAGMAALRRAARSEDRFARDRAREALSLSAPAREPVVGTLELSSVPDPATNVTA